MFLSDILREGEYSSSQDPREIRFTRIISDTAFLEKDCLFVCLEGMHFDSHALASLAAAEGAAAVIAEEGHAVSLPDGFPLFRVRSTRSILAHLISRSLGESWKKSRLIAITGTNGKTSTLYLTAAIFKAAGYRVGCIGTVDISLDGQKFPLTPREEKAVKTMTTPDPAFLFPILCRMAEAGADYIIMEASSHALAQRKLDPLVFEAGLFTNLSPEHLDFHKNMKEYLSAKARLFPLCRLAILNADSPYADEIVRGREGKTVLVGHDMRADYYSYETFFRSSHGTSFTLKANNKNYRFEIPIAGSYNFENARLAAATALEMGIDAEDVRRALAEFQGVPGRLERLTDEHVPFTVFIDYAHTEAALKRLLLTVRDFRAEGERIVLLFGCGGERDSSKRAPMGTVAEYYADYTVVTSDNPRNENPCLIIKDILQGMPARERRHVRVNRERAIRELIQNAQPGDLIILSGKGHESYEITKDGIRPFDERAIVFEELQRRFNINQTEKSND